MIQVKSPHELRLMEEGGHRLAAILKKLLLFAQPEVTLTDIDALADKLIADAGGTASFKTVKGYRWATCLCVNEVVVHGVPTKYRLREGDLLTIDIGMLYQGFHTDTAWTKIIRSESSELRTDTAYRIPHNIEEKEKFLKIGELALWKAIDQARPGNRVGHISRAIQETIKGAGYRVIQTLVGHGVGRRLHELPQIPGFLKGQIEKTPELQKNMTLAIEIIYAMGQPAVHYANEDGWSMATVDQSLTAVFEHTVVITDDQPLVLTQDES